ncbi:hypothetical protein HYX05_01710 [Candidatus Woesearchaeota archaeon]|nr:hypothetical protein [Candidatus Woesearchaeota archaeon]
MVDIAEAGERLSKDLERVIANIDDAERVIRIIQTRIVEKVLEIRDIIDKGDLSLMSAELDILQSHLRDLGKQNYIPSDIKKDILKFNKKIDEFRIRAKSVRDKEALLQDFYDSMKSALYATVLKGFKRVAGELDDALRNLSP